MLNTSSVQWSWTECFTCFTLLCCACWYLMQRMTKAPRSKVTLYRSNNLKTGVFLLCFHREMSVYKNCSFHPMFCAGVHTTLCTATALLLLMRVASGTNTFDIYSSSVPPFLLLPYSEIYRVWRCTGAGEERATNPSGTPWISDSAAGAEDQKLCRSE